jgi:serine/threonine protein kinase/WD40 repeat protein
MANADRLIELFDEAKARPAGREREHFLAEACPGAPDLKEQVLSLLEAHEGAGDFLKNKFPAPTVVLVTEKAGDMIGRYKLLQVIGEGGCGVVYLAEQSEPVRRKVALKVIKLGMDTKQVIARFEAERQALALMDHPNIAKVFDAGSTERPLTRPAGTLSSSGGEGRGEGDAAYPRPSDGRGAGGEGLSAGRPYFVMELVRGIKITDYCDQNKLSTIERLDLFIQVCQAIQHAHQKGIIHRDIKPSNILVAQHDTVAVPKVIDFGIAKATSDQPLTDKTLFTAFEQFMGTPAYMSPEQAQLSGLDIDTRTDIYSLGVLLYELLTGNPPFDPEELMRSGLDAMRRTIREVEPVKPSTRLNQELLRTQGGKGEKEKRGSEAASCSESPSFPSAPFPPGQAAQLRQANQTSAHRLHQLKQLIPTLRGDLDWIVMKCLEKDRTRRYETANGLATDLRRHLSNEPVVARPPSTAYRFQKLARRNKLAVASITALATVLVLGVLVSTWQAIRATRQQRTAETQRLRAETAEGDAQEKLWSAYLAQARSGRLSGQAGQRFDSLSAVVRAAAIRSSLELRNEAIASLALADLRLVSLIDVSAGQAQFVAFDQSLERFVRVDATGAVSVSRVTDSVSLMQLPGRISPSGLYSAFSPNGQFLALFHRQGGLIVWDLLSRQTALQLPGDEALLSCAFTPDNQFVVVGYRPGQLVFRDLKSGETNRSFATRGAPAEFSFSRDGEKLAAAFWASTRGEVLDSQNGRLLQQMAHTQYVLAVAWSPDGRTLATGCQDGNIYLWNVATGQKQRTVSGHRHGVNGLVFLDDEQVLASLSWDGTVRLWDTSTGRQMLVLTAGGQSPRFNPYTRRLGFQYNTARLQLYEVVSPAVVRIMADSPPKPGPGVEFVDFSPDERWLTSGAEDGVRCWDVASGHREAHLPMQLARTVLFPPGGASLITCAASGLLHWPLSQPSAEEIILGPPQPAAPALNAPQGFARAGLGYQSEVFTAISLGAIRGYRSGTNFLELDDSNDTRSIATSADGRWIAAGFRTRGGVRLWNASTGRVVHDFPTFDRANVTFTPDNRWLVAGASDEYSFWDLATGGRGLRLPRAQSGTLWGPMAFSADGRLMAIARSRSSVQLLEAGTGRELASLEPPNPQGVGWLAFSPSGTQLAVASDLVHVWDLRRLRQALAALKLDWDQPTLPSPNPTSPDLPLRFKVLGAPVAAGR